jgi:hypothetical protein
MLSISMLIGAVCLGLVGCAHDAAREPGPQPRGDAYVTEAHVRTRSAEESQDIAGRGAIASAQESGAANPVSREIRAEARNLQHQQPEQWARWLRRLDEAVVAYDQRHAGWMRRSLPPPLDLKPLALPLPVLVYRLEHPVEPGATGRIWSRLPWPLLDAIAHHADRRRMGYLLEQHDHCDFGAAHDWRESVVEALTTERAAEVIAARMDPRPTGMDYGDLAYLLLDRHAATLPPELRAGGYAHLRRATPSVPRSETTSELWRTLLKLDVAAASRELVAQYVAADLARSGDLIWRVPQLLAEAGPVPGDVALSLKRFLDTDRLGDDAQHLRARLRVVLFRSSPAAELPEFVQEIDQAIAVAGTGTAARTRTAIATLTESLLVDGPLQALPTFRRLVGCLQVPMPTRDAMVERLVRAGDAEAGAAVRAWCEVASPARVAWLKQSLPAWGPAGADLATMLH